MVLMLKINCRDNRTEVKKTLTSINYQDNSTTEKSRSFAYIIKNREAGDGGYCVVFPSFSSPPVFPCPGMCVFFFTASDLRLALSVTNLMLCRVNKLYNCSLASQ